MAVDDSLTKVLLHFDGAGTVFTDESGKTWTAVNNAQLDTAQFKFGSASGLFDGVNDYIYTADHADFVLGTNDFTIDCQIRLAAAVGSGLAYVIYSQSAGTGDRFFLSLYYDGASYLSQLYASSAGPAYLNALSGTFALATGNWYHLAVTKNVGTFRFFVNGTQQGTAPVDTSEIANYGTTPTIGVETHTLTGDFNGWMDEFRFGNGTARWTANFTAPTSAYAPPITSYPQLIMMGG